MSKSKGILLALLTALISGVSVFVNSVAVKLSDPFIYTFLKNTGALVFLGAMVLGFSELRHFRGLGRRQWGLLVLVGLAGGSVPFLMFFWGLSLGGAAVSSFIYRSLFVFAGIAGYALLREKPEPRDMAAGLMILAGNAMLISGDLAFGLGQALVLGATALWAVEYTISRKLLSDVRPRVVMVSRMLFGSLALLVFLGGTGSLAAEFTIDFQLLGWLSVTSLLLAGFLVSWYNALKHLPVLKATSILALGGLVTAALDMAFKGTTLALADAAGLLLILLGVVLMVSLGELAGAVSAARKLSPGLAE
jgi:drug/metabolite transporter (DMT)-like permease